MHGAALVDFAPTLRLLLMAAALAMLPLAVVWLRSRRGDASVRLAHLTALTLFLTFDLIVFGAFTRLTDSGLGCPDWPGCYGHASPIGASTHIDAAEAAMPAGPVTTSKAWIEMIHRYLAMTVGALILVMTVVSWLERRRLPHSPWWPTLTLAWVIVQGLFGKYTVTWKLYPLVVTLHLFGGLLLLVLLAQQHESFRERPLTLRPRTRALLWLALGAVFVQAALGGWVSTNYAVLACPDVPTCHGQWWPPMDFANGFTLRRELGATADGTFLPYDALVAIQVVHRLGAVVLTAVLLVLAAMLRTETSPVARRHALVTVLLLAAQLISGLSNVVLGWPIVAALAHSAGAAALALLPALLLARSRQPVVAAVAALPAVATAG
jgi:cytochrome c oxidase assembly protein subunit 15